MSDKAEIWKSAEDAVVAGDDNTLAQLLREHEKMLRTEQPRSSWLGGLTPDYTDDDARAIIVRHHFFEHWEQFAGFATQVKNASSPVAHFERAVDAVVAGDAAWLERALHDHPDLVGAPLRHIPRSLASCRPSAAQLTNVRCERRRWHLRHAVQLDPGDLRAARI